VQGNEQGYDDKIEEIVRGALFTYSLLYLLPLSPPFPPCIVSAVGSDCDCYGYSHVV
jgi:hypothetical protein